MNIDNRTLCIGDNLKFLRGIDSETVDLVVTDPPFNKSRDFHATPGSLAAGAKFQDRWSWDQDIDQKWVDAIADNGWEAVREVIEAAYNAHSEGMAAFLCFMGVRLIEMRRVLKPTGTLYLHCDPTASHYLKSLLDAIFGAANFRNEIVWCYSGGGVPRRDYPRKHDCILRYTKGDKWIFNVARKPYKANTQQVGKHSTLAGGNLDIDLERGTPITDWWTDVHTVTGWSPENTGWPTQKPIALCERLILASSNPGDLVLDPFCGCATTCVAAEKHQRLWVGMDIWKGSGQIVTTRLRDLGQTEDLLVNKPRIIRKVPYRSDDGMPAVAPLSPKLKSRHRPMTLFTSKDKAEKKQRLLEKHGLQCQGCTRHFPNETYLEIDHRIPRAMMRDLLPDAGADYIHSLENLTLLCSPCNRLKSDNSWTLEDLYKELKRRGLLTDVLEKRK